MANKTNDARTICVRGRLTDEGVECQALRTVDGDLLTLIGDLKGFKVGDEVVVCGTIVDVSFCMQGTTIVISWIGTPPHTAGRSGAIERAPVIPFEGSPIVVGGGGSVGIVFNSAHYAPTGRPNEFAALTDEVHAGYLYKGLVPQDLTPNMAGKNVTLTIACLDATGLDSQIIIDSRPRGPLRIRFRVSDYPFDASKQQYYSPDRTLTSIRLQDNSGATQPQTLLADPAGRVEIINNQ